MQVTLPDELKKVLDNPHLSTYAYIGDEGDKGWKVALAVRRNTPGLGIYRVPPSNEQTFREAFNVPEAHVGIVFDWGIVVKKRLSKEESEDFLVVRSAITAARA